jgi:hypothetical protein
LRFIEFPWVPERSVTLAVTLQIGALQWANSGNNMTGKPFQIFLGPSVARLHSFFALLASVDSLHRIVGVNLTPGGRNLLADGQLRQQGHFFG